MSQLSQLNRRTVLKAGGVLAFAGLTASSGAIAQTDLNLEIEPNAEDEYVTIRNLGEDDADITGYSINFEAAPDDNVDQIRQLAGDVVIPAGEEIRVATGALEVSGDNVVQLADPYDGEVLNNEDPDVVALLNADGETVVSSGETGGGDDDDDGGDDGDDDDGSDDDDDEDDRTATGIVTVIDQDGEPVEGEPVEIWPPGTVEQEATETRETNADGEVVIELLAGDPTDVAMHRIVVREQEQRLGIMSDEHQGIQEVVFEVNTEADEEPPEDEDEDEEPPEDDGSESESESKSESESDDADAEDDAGEECP